MAYDPNTLASMLEELQKRQGADQVRFFEGMLMRTEYNALADALTMMRAAANEMSASAAVRIGNDTASKMMYGYIENQANADGIDPDDRFWR